MSSTDLTRSLPPELVKPLGSHVHVTRYGRSRTLSFDHYFGWSPNVPEVEEFYQLGWAHQWNALSDRHKRRGMAHGTSVGAYIWQPLLHDEDPFEVAVAMLTAWTTGDTTKVCALTRKRVAALPPASEYRRGQDIHVRLGDAHHARVWSYPKRGLISVRHQDGTAEEVESL